MLILSSRVENHRIETYLAYESLFKALKWPLSAYNNNVGLKLHGKMKNTIELW